MDLNHQMILIQELKEKVSEDSADIIDIYNAIYERLQDLENEKQQEALDLGYCFHTDLIDVTTLGDMADGWRRYMCKDCREILYRPVKKDD